MSVANMLEAARITAPTRKPAAVKKPAPSLTAQVKSLKAELKATKAGLVTALDNLESRTSWYDAEISTLNAQLITVRANCIAAKDLVTRMAYTAVATPEAMITALGEYRDKNSVDPTTDAVILRLINRLTNLG